MIEAINECTFILCWHKRMQFHVLTKNVAILHIFTSPWNSRTLKNTLSVNIEMRKRFCHFVLWIKFLRIWKCWFFVWKIGVKMVNSQRLSFKAFEKEVSKYSVLREKKNECFVDFCCSNVNSTHFTVRSSSEYKQSGALITWNKKNMNIKMAKK